MLQDYEFCSNFVTKFKNEEKKMKKILGVLLAGAVALTCFTACNSSTQENS